MNLKESKQYCSELYSEHPDLIKKWENSQNLMDRAYAEIVKECAGVTEC